MGPFPFLVLFLLLCPIAALGSPPEQRALMELKASLDPAGRVLSSWTSDGDPCRGDFLGVACNEHGKVANISLQGKGLSGSLSPALAELKCLSGLYLHYNSLVGNIPREIANLTELNDLYLNVNNLSGSIPAEIGNLGSLQVLQLCYNQLTGSLPTQLGLLKKLNVLALQSNHLTGAIPAALADLTQLTRLDLSSNQLFGSIPVKLAQLPQLVAFDVRNNSLSGNVPSDLKRLQGGFQYGNNSDLCGSGFLSLRACTSADDPIRPDRPEPFSAGLTPQAIPNETHHPVSLKPPALAAIVAAIVAIIFGAAAVAVLAFSGYSYRKQKIDGAGQSTKGHVKDAYRRSASPLINIEYSHGWDAMDAASQSYKFNLEEVEFATLYFSDANLLGNRGKFAATYKGTLRDGTMVAVKRLSKSSCKQEEADFIKGLRLLTELRHESLVGLRGFCCSRGRGECFLVYDFVHNGSLSQYLDVGNDDDGHVLDWSTRVSIIEGIAKGIEFLHCNRTNKPPVVHQSISSDKVLIHYNFKALLSGSGLHRLLADDVVFSALKTSAAMGYLAPEYATVGRFTEKSDVYAFGVIMLQIITGKSKAVNSRPGAGSGKLEELIDVNLKGNYSTPQAAKLASIALLCTSESPNQRPTMEELVEELSRI